MPRADISKDVVHWVKAASDDAAFETLSKIVRERRLLGGNGFIKGEFLCVCFSEAPADCFHDVTGKYRPFGIRLRKAHLFARGGRPVIYQAANEYDQLHELQKWRHVRYEPDGDPPIDLSWEREWRIRTDHFELDPRETNIIVPHEDWAHELIEEHDMEALAYNEMTAINYGEEWAYGRGEDFPFSWSVLPEKPPA